MQANSARGYQGYVLSNHLVAAALAMVSEERDMNGVYEELWSCRGNQIQAGARTVPHTSSPRHPPGSSVLDSMVGPTLRLTRTVMCFHHLLNSGRFLATCPTGMILVLAAGAPVLPREVVPTMRAQAVRPAAGQVRVVADFIDVGVGEALSFWDITCLVRMSREIAIGYIPHVPTPHDDGGFARVPSAASSVSGGRRGASRIVLNPQDKAAPREWHPQDRIIVVGTCRQAKAKVGLAEARREAEAVVHARFAAGGGGEQWLEAWGRTLEHHGWLRVLRQGCEEVMEDEASWDDRLCFVVGGELVHAAGDGGRTRPLCRLAAIRGIQSFFWPPGYNTFRVELGGGSTLTFSAVSVEDCRGWIAALQVCERVGRIATAADRLNGWKKIQRQVPYTLHAALYCKEKKEGVVAL